MRCKDLDKQQRIKEAMIALFLREGIDGTSVSKIAREAGVSPATIYIYYDSKEEMLEEVFREYSHQSFGYLMHRLRPDMSGAQFIDALVRGFYAYTVEHEEAFSFVEQCSRCPTLCRNVREEECGCEFFDLLHLYQDRGEVRHYSDPNLAAVLLAPVRYIAMNQRESCRENSAVLDELVEMLKSMLLC